MRWCVLILFAFAAQGAALAGEADVVAATLTPAGDGTWRAEVTALVERASMRELSASTHGGLTGSCA